MTRARLAWTQFCRRTSSTWSFASFSSNSLRLILPDAVVASASCFFCTALLLVHYNKISARFPVLSELKTTSLHFASRYIEREGCRRRACDNGIIEATKLNKGEPHSNNRQVSRRSTRARSAVRPRHRCRPAHLLSYFFAEDSKCCPCIAQNLGN